MDKKDYFSNYKREALMALGSKARVLTFQPRACSPTTAPYARAERSHRIRQDFRGEQDLLIKAIYKVPISPVGATFSQGNKAEHRGASMCIGTPGK